VLLAVAMKKKHPPHKIAVLVIVDVDGVGYEEGVIVLHATSFTMLTLHDDAWRFVLLQSWLVVFQPLYLLHIDRTPASLADEVDSLERGHPVFNQGDCNKHRCPSKPCNTMHAYGLFVTPLLSEHSTKQVQPFVDDLVGGGPTIMEW